MPILNLLGLEPGTTLAVYLSMKTKAILLLRIKLILFSWAILAFCLFTQSVHAESIRYPSEFTSPSTYKTYGVDMNFAPKAPNFDYNSSYSPTSADAQIEKSIEDQQTTDYVVEKKWIEVKRAITAQQNAQANP